MATGSDNVSIYAEKEITCYKYTLMQNDHTSTDKGSAVALCSTTDGVNFNAVWTCPANKVGTAHYFYVTKNTDPSAQTKCDFLYNNREITETSSPQKISLYGATNNQYNHSWKLIPTRAGDYTFTLTLGSTNYFDCEFPPLVDPVVAFNNLPSSVTKGQEVIFAATSENITDPVYVYYVKASTDADYGAALEGNNYTFSTLGSYNVKVEARQGSATGELKASAESNINCTASFTIYFKDMVNWGKVYVHLYTDDKTFSSTQGVGGQAADINAKMTQIEESSFYQYSFTASKEYTKVCFTYSNQNNYEYFYDNNKCSWSDNGLDFTNGMVLWIPDASASEPLNNCTYYNTGVWSVYPPTDPSVEFSGLPPVVSQGQEVKFAATSENVTNPAYTYYVQAPGATDYTALTGDTYTFSAGGTYMVKVEVREEGATGAALAYAEKAVGCPMDYTVYFRNTVNWSSVYIHLYTNNTTLDGNGVGGVEAAENAQMTLVENTTDYYEYTYQAAEPYTKVCFTLKAQNNYDGFNNNECSWSDAGYDATNGLVLWTPDNSVTTPLNGCTYFNTGTWTAFAPGQPNVSFVGLSSTIAKGTNVAFEAEALNVTNPTYRFYVKPEGGEYGAALTSYNFDTEGNYTVKVEVRSNDTGDALAYAEQDVTCALMYTVYFQNTMNWENVYVHFYSDDQTFGNNGVGGQDALLQAQMEQVGTSNIYTYSYTSDVAYTKVCFTLKEQYGYGQFHNNECSWSDAGLNYDTHEVLWIPNGVISHNINSCPYYDGKWFVYPSNDASVAFISLPAEVENGQSINLANYVVTMNVTDPAYTFYIKQGNDDYTAIASSYTFTVSGTYMLKVEVRESGETDLLAYDEAEITVPLIPTEFFLAGSFNNWSQTANCFRKASENAEEATTKITINEYSNITFKVVESGNWIGAEDQAVDKDHTSFTLGTESLNNIRLIPYAAGDYIFTLKLDDSRLLTVTYPDGEQMPVPVNLYASGQFNNWAESSSTYKFTAVGDIATLTLQNLEANHDYEFKLIYNEAWLGANYTIKYHYNWEIPFSENTSENAVLKTFKAGDYILSYQISSGLLTVTYPTDGLETKQVEILAQADGYATFYSNKGWDYPAEVEAFYVSDVTSSGNLTMVPLLGYIPAWVPVILHANPDTYTFYECDDETWIDGNMLKGTIDNQVINNEHTHYIMTLSGGVPGLYWPFGTNAGIGEFENQAGKAYLEVPVTTPISGNVIARRGFPFIPQSDMPTSVESVEQKGESGKFLREGNLFIIREGRIFNAQGARIR